MAHHLRRPLTIAPPELRVLPSPEAVAQAGAELLARAAAESVAQRGRFVLALSGGNTPALLYRLLASDDFASRIPWQQTFLFWGDERWVPRDDPASNAGMTARELLGHVPVPEEHIEPVETTGLTPEQSAERYEERLRALFPGRDLPRLDLVLLGMGPDGHTASLFPGTAALDERTRLVTANPVPQMDTVRITFTLPLINAARHVIFMVNGADKAPALRQVLEPAPGEAALPASLVQPADGPGGAGVTWLVDHNAAALLHRHG